MKLDWRKRKPAEESRARLPGRGGSFTGGPRPAEPLWEEEKTLGFWGTEFWGVLSRLVLEGRGLSPQPWVPSWPLQHGPGLLGLGGGHCRPVSPPRR